MFLKFTPRTTDAKSDKLHRFVRAYVRGLCNEIKDVDGAFFARCEKYVFNRTHLYRIYPRSVEKNCCNKILHGMNR